jgi:hypothetical protein
MPKTFQICRLCAKYPSVCMCHKPEIVEAHWIPKPKKVGLQRLVRARRRKKIKAAQHAVEEELLSLRAMYGSDTEMWKQTSAAFGQLYYLLNLANKAP